MAFTIENIISVQLLSDLTLSPDASKIVYCLTPSVKTGDHQTTALWYSSDTAKADSAKQLTSGLYNDGSPAWHPNSEKVYFLSDRHKQGGPRQIYQYSLDGPGEPNLLGEQFKEKKRGINTFRVSPDGKYIAFSSPDEPSAEEERKEKEKEDERVWGEKKGLARLRLYTISTGEVRTVVEDPKHVVRFNWRSDSKGLVYLLTERPDIESQSQTTSLHTVSIVPFSHTPETKRLVDLPRAPLGDVLWLSPSHPYLYTILCYDPHKLVDAMAVHRISTDDDSPGQLTESHFYLGEKEDPVLLVELGSQGTEFAVAVGSGMDTRVDIVDDSGKAFTLYGTDRRGGLRLLDVKKIGNEYVLACCYSSGPDKQAPNVWVGRVSGRQKLDLTVKLSSHTPWIANEKVGSVEIFEWKGEDGVVLEGMAYFPQGLDSSNVMKPLPTILDVHGGPYGRDTPALNPYFLDWAPILAERGFLVLNPNYRGSSARGSAFARAARYGVGTVDWSDVLGMIDEAVKRGLADKDKLGIGGWSQGGFLTAWGVSQTKNKFKCAIMGAGVSDWGSMATESDIPDVENELGGGAPWRGAAARLTADPVRHVEDIETSMLILHGERDERVPVGQAIGFHRGLRRRSKYPNRHALVIYPREGHIFVERKHAEDVLKRVIEHYEAWL